MESVFYGMVKLNTMTNEEIYENVMGHKPNKEFGLKGSFSWDDIDALMTAVKNCSIPAVVGQSEQLVCDKCGYPMFYHKPDDIMYCHGCNNTKPAN